MTFEKFWNAIMLRNQWEPETELKVNASGVATLAARAYQEGFEAGEAASKEAAAKNQLNDFLRTGRL